MAEAEVVYSSRHILDEDAHLKEREKVTLKRVCERIERDAEGLK